MLRTTYSRARPTAQRGFTAIELMVVVAILGILVALAAPSFTPILERWRVRSTADALQHSYYLARSEAIKRGGGVTMTRLASAGTCASSGVDDWKCGWQITDAGGNVLHETINPPNTDVAVVTGGGTGSMPFDRYGMMTDAVGTAVFSMEAQIVAKNKTISDDGSLKLCVKGTRLARIKGTSNC